MLNLKFYKGKDLYSDGDIEEEILRIVKQNETGDFSDILAKDNRWPILYHLSPIRHNLLEWYPFPQDASLLEIGAGCGALTCFFCEKVKFVTAVELSKRRAEIIAERCKKHKNLEIIVGNFQDIDFNKKYDYITLIGVLEYAGKFIDSPTPYETFLGEIKKLLNPGGIVFIAIENQFGLKYFAGAKEDHIGMEFAGITGYSPEAGCRTFGKNVLTELVRTSGFIQHKFYYPYPDYKICELIFSDEYKPPLSFFESYTPNYDYEKTILFNEKQALYNILKNNDLSSFSNSFLLICSSDKTDLHTENIICHKTNYRRKPAFQTALTISYDEKAPVFKKTIKHPDNSSSLKKITSVYHSLSNLIIVNNVFYNKIFPIDETSYYAEFVDGVSLEDSIFTAITEADIDKFNSLVKEYHSFLSNSFKVKIRVPELYEFLNFLGISEGVPNSIDSVLCFEEYTNIDLSPGNILKKDKNYTIIDYEWSFPFSLPVNYVFFRGIKYLYEHFSPFMPKKFPSFPDLMHKYNINDYLLNVFDIIEGHFQSFVFGNKRKYDINVNYLKKQQSLAGLLIEKDNRIANLQKQLEAKEVEKEKLITEHRNSVKRLHELLTEKDKIIADKDRQIHHILNTWSMKITRPLRSKFLKKIYDLCFGNKYTNPIKIIRIGKIILNLMLLTGKHPKLVGKFLKIWKRFGFYDALKAAVETSKLHLNMLPRSPEYYIQYLNVKKIREIISKFKKQPLISIIVPVYNVEPKWLESAIKSVFEQIYDNWELCIVDDCSSNRKTLKYLKNLPSIYKEMYSEVNKKPEISAHISQESRTYNRDELPESYVSELKRLDIPASLIKHLSVTGKIKIILLERNTGISNASNVAVAVSEGEYMTFLDNDDELAPNALFESVKIINEKNAEFVYSDEDLVDINGRYLHPHYKPNYAPDNLLAHNYITHLAVIKTKLIKEIKGFRSKCDGAQDYDLFLRITELTNKIEHIPKILYHWRTLPQSTSINPQGKSYAVDAGRIAVEDALKRRNIEAKVISDEKIAFFYIVRRKIIGNPLISIIIPFKDKPDFLSRCIESIIEKSTYKDFEIIAVNNNSEETETFETIKKLEKYDNRISFINYEGPFNFSAINNYAVRKFAQGQHILLLNNDIVVINNDWLEALLEHSQRPEVGAVGAKLYYPNDLIQHAGVIIGLGGVAAHSHKGYHRNQMGYFSRLRYIQNISAVTAACLMVKKELYLKLGGLNENELKIAFNDVDFCLRLREKGYLNIFTPFCELYHYESVSRGYEDTKEKIKRFEKECEYIRERHKTILKEGDPFYNPNLTLASEDFSWIRHVVYKI